jgi:predicted O-linked N-acetylglucosamine transferase (SPINDLY family)
MIDQQKHKRIQHHLRQDNYNELIMVLEQYIEQVPQELDYYWYLGLAHLLKENEEVAQEIWLSVLLNGNLEEAKIWTQDLITFLEIKVNENITIHKLGSAKVIYEAIFGINSDYQNIELQTKLVQSLCLFASNLSFNREYEAAIEIYQEALNLDPEHQISCHALALTYYYLENYSEAEKLIDKAISLDLNIAQNYHVLGMILEKQANFSGAILAYERAIIKDPKLLSSYQALIGLCIQQQQKEPIIKISQAVVSRKNSSLLKYLGDAYQALDESSQANLYYGYSAYYSQDNGCLFTALSYFEKYYINHADQVDNNFNFYCVFSDCYVMSNQPDYAMKILKRASVLFPEFRITIKRLNQFILPILYKDVEEIEFYHQRFQTLLRELIAATKTDTPTEKKDVLYSLGLKTNFYLSYQGKNDCSIQKQYGEYVHALMQKARPQWCQPIERNLVTASRKIRVGYVSSRLDNLGILYLGWLKYSNKNRFEVYVYDIQSETQNSNLSAIKSYFKFYSDQFFSLSINSDWDEVCQKITTAQLDILIFPDLGLDPTLNFLSYLRLAPVQCTTWAHPVTSGSPTIDYFLSSDFMEPANGDEHYSEKLIRLPNLGFSLPPVKLPKSDKSRLDFQLKDNVIIYLCTQSLFKYLPQHDYVFPMIAQHSELFQFVFVDPRHGEVVTKFFKKRLERAFGQFDLNYQKYCTFLPRLTGADFLKLHQLGDIFLDGLSWSGGLTTRDAIACGLPVVTRPGEFMRGRHSYGILRMLGVMETAAESESDYINIAVRLGLDQTYRQNIRDKIIVNQNLIFDDQECILGLETFFEQIVQKKL